MHYMARHGTKRTRPAELLPGTLRIISVRMNYLVDEPDPAAILDDPARKVFDTHSIVLPRGGLRHGEGVPPRHVAAVGEEHQRIAGLQLDGRDAESTAEVLFHDAMSRYLAELAGESTPFERWTVVEEAAEETT